jgi:hypothetical protein
MSGDPKAVLAMLPVAARKLAEERQRRQALDDVPAELPPREVLEADWRIWLTTLFRRYVSDSEGRLIPFADHQAELWTWLFQLRRGVRPVPFVGI